MNIIDIHVHTAISSLNTMLYPEYDMVKLKNDCITNNIKQAAVFLNPFVKQILCPVDHHHKIKTLDSSCRGFLRLYCTVCNRVYYEGIDPIRDYNEKLLEQCLYDNTLLPFVFLNISKSSTVSEMEYFEKMYGSRIVGYKMHPALSNRSIDEFDYLPTNKPIIIHTGVGEFEHPMHVINFSRTHKGKILLSHFAKFEEESLHEISRNENLFVDSSPSCFIYNQHLLKPDKIFDINYLDGFDSWQDMMRKAFKGFGIEKIVYGSDSPWGNMNNELSAICNSGFSDREIENYLYYNARSFIGI